MFDKYIQDFKDDDHPEKCALSRPPTVVMTPAAHATAHPRCLSFSVVQELFTKHSVGTAEKEIGKLKQAGEHAEREMRAQMVKHYQQYIRMADETSEIAGPMGRMRSRLHDLRDVCTELRDRAEGDARAISAAKEQGLLDAMDKATRDQLSAVGSGREQLSQVPPAPPPPHAIPESPLCVRLPMRIWRVTSTTSTS